MNVLTVSQVNTYIKALINEIPQVKNIYISGEISNFKHYYKSGHMYFTLKDEKSQLKCVMFAFDNSKIKFTPEDGMKVICLGQIDVYERDGVYQLYVRDMHPQGVGSLTIAFEQLKAKLEEEGLFNAEHKKPIPKYPKKIGVATSNMGAAVEDIKNVTKRRFPLCEVVIVPTVVQGDEATADIVKSIELLDSLGDIDTIIVGRGGGSIEDLWAFNTEPVARAVYNCKTPIISAVGHETDYTICDFVADLRAPTPSAAAELAVPDYKNELIKINSFSVSLEKSIDYKIESETKRIEQLVKGSPLFNKEDYYQRVSDRLSELDSRMVLHFKNILLEKENSFKAAVGMLNALSPLAVLSRGYAITSNSKGIVKSVDDVEKNEEIDIKLFDGTIKAKAYEVNKNG